MLTDKIYSFDSFGARRRLVRLAAVCLVLMVIFSSFAFLNDSQALDVVENKGNSGLRLEDSSPKEGTKNMPLENIGIKLYFNRDVTGDDVWENNKSAFRFTDKKNKKFKTSAYRKKGEGNYILVTASLGKGKKLKSKTDYKLIIDEKLLSTDNFTMSKDYTLHLRTVDMENLTQINMFLMGGMVVVVIGMTMFTAKRKARREAEEAAGPKEEKKVNPYKMAKEKGISVQEAMAQIEKDRAKKAKRQAKAEKDKETEAQKSDSKKANKETPKKTYKVKKPRAIKR